jgi:uncharacterized membrane protein YgdD (TMEM256/DUF423 family)
MSVVEDAVGLASLAGEFAAAMFLVSVGGMSPAAWIGLYSIVAIIAVACWHSNKAPQSSRGWFQMIAGSFILGALFFAGDILIGHFSRPNLPLIEAGKQAPFGLFLTLAACPGFTMVAAAGLVRTVFRTKLLARNSSSH